MDSKPRFSASALIALLLPDAADLLAAAAASMGVAAARHGALALVWLFLGGVWLFRNWQRLVIQRGRAPKLNVLEIRSLGGRQALYVVGYEAGTFSDRLLARRREFLQSTATTAAVLPRKITRPRSRLCPSVRPGAERQMNRALPLSTATPRVRSCGFPRAMTAPGAAPFPAARFPASAQTNFHHRFRSASKSPSARTTARRTWIRPSKCFSSSRCCRSRPRFCC